MPESVVDRATRWAAEAGDPSDEYSGAGYPWLLSYIGYLVNYVFVEYEPTSGSGRDFWLRCRDWLDSAASEIDQQLLFR
jgi:hypothetical protein